MRGHGGDVFDLGVGMRHQAMVDVHDLFAQDDGGAFKREIVQGRRYGAFQRVFLGDDAVLAFAAVDAIEHLVER